MFSKITAALAGLALVLLVSGCDNSPTPEAVFNDYAAASLKSEHGKAYDLLSSVDKKVMSREDYIASNSVEQLPFADMLMEATSYKILNSTVEGDKAILNIEVTMPNMMVVMQEMFAQAMAMGENAEENPDIAKNLQEKYGEEGLPTITEVQDVHMVREADGWRVSMGWNESGMDSHDHDHDHDHEGGEEHDHEH